MRLVFSRRRREIDYFRQNGVEVQYRQLQQLIGQLEGTELGRRYGISALDSYESFAGKVPLGDYLSMNKDILRTKNGEQNVLWPSEIKWFAQSSGTTDSKSKYIPVSEEGLKQSHLQGPKDVMAVFADNYPDSDIFLGKILTLGGSCRIERGGESAFTGDLSAILIENTPLWASTRRIPSVETALIPDFDLKVRRICEEAEGENISAFAGVPSWNLVLMQYVLEYTGKSNILEVWPAMELFVHGGVNFAPYREQYRKLFPSPDMKYMDTYNASEGFFAIGDMPERDDMLLMLDYGQFYEFVPVDSLNDASKVIPLEGVREGVNYAMIITTSGGLWRYMIGDTVEFTSTAPYRIRITGRTKLYINTFGEELMIANAEEAVVAACKATGAQITEFTAAPIYMEGRTKGAHQWIVEFSTEPSDRSVFITSLDTRLKELNSDYEAKRFADATLRMPVLTVAPEGTFLRWMEKRGKIGGQNKVPRLSDDRKFVEEILEMIN